MLRRILLLVAALLLGAGALTACQKARTAAKPPAGDAPAKSFALTGAGATFPAPLYQQWAKTYQASSGVALTYRPTDSGDGVIQVEAGAVDFGASDKPLTPEDLARGRLYQFPVVLGGVVPIFNLGGVRAGQLKLTGAVLADIFLGEITRWDDPRIAGLNPDLRLPATAIVPVRRSDPSGSNFVIMAYLSKASPTFATRTAQARPRPDGLYADSSAAVTEVVKRTPGALGYVEVAYAHRAGVPYALVRNRAGRYPQPEPQSFAAADDAAGWNRVLGDHMVLVDEPGPEAWPITGATFILVPRRQKDWARASDLLNFFDWAYRNGDPAADQLDYVPLPAAAKDLVRRQWTSEIEGPDGKPVYRPD